MYVSKQNPNCKKQVNLVMILNGQGLYCIAVKTLPVLLSWITSKQHGDSYCLNCLHSCTATKKIESHKKYVKIKIFNFKMSSEETKILKFTEYQKFDKLSFIIYVDLQSLIKKIEKFKYNFEKTVTTKVREHTSLYFSMSVSSSK